MILLDSSQINDTDTFLLGALTLAAATGQPFEMQGVGKRASTPGVTPFHLTAMRALGVLCGATLRGDVVRTREVRFTPAHAPQRWDGVVDTGAATGRPSPAAITPLVEALLTVLSCAEGDSFVRVQGTNVAPNHPSAFWLREVLAPTLRAIGLVASVEIERWGWFPDGGGETTLLVEGGSHVPSGRLVWEERGDPVGGWALAALSARMEERVGQTMADTFHRATGGFPLGPVAFEVARVRSPGPGSGLFIVVQFEQGIAGFEAMSHQGMAPAKVAEDAVAALTHFFWSDAAFEPELARALLIPLALHGRAATFTTSELTRPMQLVSELIPQFLPMTVTLDKHPAGGRVTLRPNTPG